MLNSNGRLRRFGALFGAFRAPSGAYWGWKTPRPQNWGEFSNPIWRRARRAVAVKSVNEEAAG